MIQAHPLHTRLQTHMPSPTSGSGPLNAWDQALPARIEGPGRSYVAAVHPNSLGAAVFSMLRNRLSYLLVVCALLLGVAALAPASLQAAPGAGLEWRTHRTERFLIHYPASSAPEDPLAVNGGRIALRVSQLAEQAYEDLQASLPVTLPLPIHIVLDAHLAREVGEATPEANRIEISTHPGPFFFFRERGDWLKERVTHELAHLFLTKAGSPLPPGVAAEVEVRVADRAWLARATGAAVTGDPELSFGAKLPLLDASPYFWREGGAEFLASQAGASRWDPARDMLLRMSAYESLTLSPTGALSPLGLSGLDGERIYNQGFAFLLFLKERYGEEAFARLLQTAAQKPRWDWLSVFEEGQGISYELLQGRFREWVTLRYPPPAAQREYVVGEELDLAVRPWRSTDLDVRRRWMALPQTARRAQREEGGLVQAHPRWSGDGRLLAWWDQGLKVRAITEEQWSAFGGRPLNPIQDRLQLARKDAQVGSIPAGLPYAASFSPDSKRLVMVADANWRPRGGGGSIARAWPALFIVNVEETVKGVRLAPAAPGLPIPNTLRAQDPAWSPDGKWIAYVRYIDGTANLWIVRPDGSDARALTGFKDGTDMASPAWSPDSKRLVFELFRQNERDLWVLDVEQVTLEPIMLDAAIDLQPTWAQDGRIYYSSDASGTYNLYAFDPSTLEVQQVTDVPGGAFMPTLAPSGNLTYVNFDGYALRLYGLPAAKFANRAYDNAAFFVDPTLTRGVLQGAHEAPAAEGSTYRAWRGGLRMQLVPQLVLTERAVAAGVEARFQDPLDRTQLRISALGGSGHVFGAELTQVSEPFRVALSVERALHREANALRTGDGTSAVVLERTRDQQLRRGSFKVSRMLDGLGVAEVLLLGDHLRYRERQDATTLHSLHASAGVEARFVRSTFSADPQHGAHGLDPRGGYWLSLGVGSRMASAWDPFTGGLVEDAGEALESRVFQQVDMSFQQAIAYPGSTLEWRLDVGWISQNVSWWDELKAGGTQAAPGDLGGIAYRFPGYEAGSLSGETLGIVSLAWRTPLRESLGRRVGPFYLTTLYGQLGATVGNVWGYVESDAGALREIPGVDVPSRSQVDLSTPGFLAEAGLELRLAATAFNRYHWGSMLHLGYAFVPVTGRGDIDRDGIVPGIYGDLLPEAGGEINPAGVRLSIGLGTGF